MVNAVNINQNKPLYVSVILYYRGINRNVEQLVYIMIIIQNKLLNISTFTCT